MLLVQFLFNLARVETHGATISIPASKNADDRSYIAARKRRIGGDMPASGVDPTPNPERRRPLSMKSDPSKTASTHPGTLPAQSPELCGNECCSRGCSPIDPSPRGVPASPTSDFIPRAIDPSTQRPVPLLPSITHTPQQAHSFPSSSDKEILNLLCISTVGRLFTAHVMAIPKIFLHNRMERERGTSGEHVRC